MRRDGNRSAEKLKSEIAGEHIPSVLDRAPLKKSQVFLKCAVLEA